MPNPTQREDCEERSRAHPSGFTVNGLCFCCHEAQIYYCCQMPDRAYTARSNSASCGFESITSQCWQYSHSYMLNKTKLNIHLSLVSRSWCICSPGTLNCSYQIHFVFHIYWAWENMAFELMGATPGSLGDVQSKSIHTILGRKL